MASKEQLLEKFYRGACSREELKLLLQWLQDDPEEEYTDLMAKLWDELNEYPELEDQTASRIIDRTLRKIEDDQPGKHGITGEDPKGRTRRRLLRNWSIAAAVLLILGIASWRLLSKPKTVEFHTVYGEQRTDTLPDGSTVKLNANSSIHFEQNWEGKEVRQVWLKGEAYFEVRRDTEDGQKFQVITRDLTVEVLGTQFNVNTREEATEVFLEEGRINVDLEEEEEDIEMEPGDMVTYSIGKGRPEKRRVGEEAPASWRTGTMIMEASVIGIIKKLEEIYGLSVRVENQILPDRSFYFPMPVSNLDTAMMVFSASTGLTIEKEEDELIIR